jgi:hypothetical protein
MKSIPLIILTLFIFSSCNAQTTQNKPQKQRPSADQVMKDLDTNEDGKLSKTEVKGPLKNDFDKIDLNKDGYLSIEEIKKAPKPKGPPRKK